MSRIGWRMLLVLGVWVAGWGSCFGDVLMVHEYASDTYMTGDEEAVLAVGYTPAAMYVDKRTRYTGSWMKRFFGEVKEQRDTTHFLLAEGLIREIDWKRGRVIAYPLDGSRRLDLFKVQAERQEQVQDIIGERYQVLEPVLEIQVAPEVSTVGGYPCRRAVATLRLETRDIKKDAASITLIRQELWASEAVPGYAQYRAFHDAMAEKMGIEAERLGNFNFLLRYWEGPLDSVRKAAADIRGYPVENRFLVQAVYVSNRSGDAPKTITKTIKEERMTLREATVVEALDKSRFMETGPFSVVSVH